MIRTEIIVTILMVFALIIAMTILLGLPIMLLWNWLMPTIFGLTKITFWQAVGINLLTSILFKLTSTINKND